MVMVVMVVDVKEFLSWLWLLGSFCHGRGFHGHGC